MLNAALRWMLPANFVVLFAAVAIAQPTQNPKPIKVVKPIKLFDGKTLTGFYTRLKETKYKDPKGVFSVRDGKVHVTGDGFGGLITTQAYKDYHLVFEFKWGPRTWGERKTRARDSGIMFHVTGAEDALGGWLPEAFQCQLQEGGTGDFYVVKARGPVALSATCEVEVKNRKRHYRSGGKKQTLTRGGVYYSKRDPNWKNELNFRGANDPDSPVGQWTRCEVICRGDAATLKVNGTTTVVATGLKPAAGKLWIQCEGAELFIRRFDLYPIGKAPRLGPVTQD